LLCNAGARPPATIEWTRLGGALLPIGQEKKLASVIFAFLRLILAIFSPSDFLDINLVVFVIWLVCSE